MKKILALMLAGCLALSMAACGGEKQPAAEESKTETTEPAATEEKKAEDKAGEDAKKVEAEVPAGGKVGVCIYKFDDAFMTTYRNALQAMLEEKGYEVTVVDGNNDQAKQTEQVNTFITQGVDALIINPVMTSAADTIIAAVQQADVPTVL
ncbi:ABC superfamily ATP binding cassette transporter, binding protein, partial [gut metagenome]